MCVYIYIYTYIHIARASASREGGEPRCRRRFRKEPVRFDSFQFRTVSDCLTIHRFGSVRFGSENQLSRFDAVRPALFERVMVRSGSLRFGSAFGSGRFRNYSVRFGSVRPVRFGFLFLPGVFSR